MKMHSTMKQINDGKLNMPLKYTLENTPSTHEFTLFASYCVSPPLTNESFAEWYNRAMTEYQESFHPDNNSDIQKKEVGA